jgi:hypothetical protein
VSFGISGYSGYGNPFYGQEFCGGLFDGVHGANTRTVNQTLNVAKVPRARWNTLVPSWLLDSGVWKFTSHLMCFVNSMRELPTNLSLDRAQEL